MPKHQSIGTWFRQQFGWSNSAQSWAERISGVVLLASAVALIWFAGSLDALTQVVLWSVWALALAVLFRRGWVQLFGPVLFYDVIRSARRGRYVLLRCLYAALLLFFLFVLFINYWDRFGSRFSSGDPDMAAQLAQDYFEVLMGVQMIVVLLLTPAYVAGSIADEKRRQTLEFLLATDLRNHEIVLSKIGSRLANLTLLVLTGLPILSMVQFLGGVDPNLVLAGFAVTGMTMLGLAGISIMCSTMYKRSRDAIALAYLMAASYIILSYLILIWQMSIPPARVSFAWWAEGSTAQDVLDWFHSGNLFLFTGLPILSMVQFLGGVDPNLVLAGFAVTGMTMLGLAGISIIYSTMYKRSHNTIALVCLMAASYIILSYLILIWQMSIRPAWVSFAWWAGDLTAQDVLDWFHSGNLFLFLADVKRAGIGGTLNTQLPILLCRYATFHGIICVTTVMYSILRLRAIALRQFGTAKSGKRGWFGHKRKTRTVFTPPMVWKEVFSEGGLNMNWLGRLIALLLVAATFIPVVMIFYMAYERARSGYSGFGFGGIARNDFWAIYWNVLQRYMNTWVRISSTIVSILTLLSVAVRASNCISSERDKQTWDSLLTTPMSGNEMLLGKWLGNITGVRFGWFWLLGIWGVGILTGGMHPFSLPLLVGAWLVYAGFLSTLGCWYSLTCRSSVRATVATLVVAALLAVGHWLPWLCCAFGGVFGRGGDGLQYIAKFQAGLTPPAVMAILPFSYQDFEHSYSRKEMTELLVFCVLGTAIWLFATFTFWNGVALTFRVKTNRTDVAFGQIRLPYDEAYDTYYRRQRPQADSSAIMDVTLIEETDIDENIQPNLPDGFNYNVRLVSEEWEDKDKKNDSDE